MIVGGITATVYRMAPLVYDRVRMSGTIGGKRMARIARVVVPGLAHHVTQRGNPREPVFCGAADYRLYCRLIAVAQRAGAELWA